MNCKLKWTMLRKKLAIIPQRLVDEILTLALANSNEEAIFQCTKWNVLEKNEGLTVKELAFVQYSKAGPDNSAFQVCRGIRWRGFHLNLSFVVWPPSEVV